MNKLNVKQFKKRFIRGLVEPELFYLPVEDYEKKICKQFTINTFFYDYYDLNLKKFVGKGYACYTQIIVKNQKTSEIVYCNKHNTILKASVTLSNIPYGEYSIRVIRAYEAIVDNKEYILNIDQENCEYDILLSWMMLKVEQTFEENPISHRIDYDRNTGVNIYNTDFYGITKFKYYDIDEKSLLHNDEYIYLYTEGILPTIADARYYKDLYSGGAYLYFPQDGIVKANYTVKYNNENSSRIKTESINIDHVFGIIKYDENNQKYVEECTIDYKHPTDEKILPFKRTKTIKNDSIEEISYTTEDRNKFHFYEYPWYYYKDDNYYQLRSNCYLTTSSTFGMFKYFIKPLSDYYSSVFSLKNSYNLDAYNLNNVNKEWFKIGLNYIQLNISNALNGVPMKGTSFSNTDSGIAWYFINDINVNSEDELSQVVNSYAEASQGTLDVIYHYYDFPSKINKESLFVKKLKHIASLQKKYNLSNNLISCRDRKIKFGDNMFSTDMFPIETTENKEVFYCFYYTPLDFSDDYDELTAKY